MKVILSVEPIRFPLTGIGRYAYELARNLAALPQVEALRYFAGSDFVPSLPEAGGAQAPAEAEPLARRVKRRLAQVPLLVDLYRHGTQTLRKRALAGTQDWVFHGPNFYLPPVAGPAVVTIHDLSVFTMPECHPPERVSYMRKEVALSLKRASMLITPTDYIRHEVARYFGWPLDRVRAAQLASSGAFAPRPPEALAPLLERYGLAAGGYTLYAGTIEPRKNLVRLIDAYSRLPATLRARFPLVLAGYKGWNNDAIMAALAKAERQGWARYLGYVPDADLPALFSGARLFAFPSLYEGFGLPVVEAMSSGVPVVCSTSSALPEVGGQAAAACAPEDVEGLTELLRRGLEDAAWREQAVAAGFGQAAKFSWRRCAEETAAIYRQALDGGRP